MSKPIKITIIVLSTLIALMVLLGVFVYRQSVNLPPLELEPTPEVIIETPKPVSEVIEVESISILLDRDEIVKGTRFLPEVVLYPEDATDRLFDIRSDNMHVLRQQGRYWVAVDVGTATLIATAVNGITGEITVTVIAPDLEGLSFFDEEEITMVVGDTITVTPVFNPVDARLDEPILYTSDDEEVVTVSEYGRISAIRTGTAIVRGTSGEIFSQFKVNVILPVRSINIVMNRRVYSVGDEAEFTIQIDPPDATNAAVTVSFSGASVTSTGENTFICNAAGEVTITFAAQGGASTNITITVHDLTTLADEVHQLTNIERANAGLPHLGRNSPLIQTAVVRATESIQLFDHVRPDGRDIRTAFEANNVQDAQTRDIGENLAAGPRSASEVVQAWMDSTSHRAAILNSGFNNMGVGVAMDNDGRIYWAQTFTD